MNKLLLFIAGLIFINLSVNAQEIVIAGWTFPGQSAVADLGIEANLNAEIMTMGGTSDIEFKNGLETKAAQATGWDDGMDSKAWILEITTSNYENLTISSVQQSGGNDPGPKDYKLQYSIDTDVWVDVPNGIIAVENDWTTSAVVDLPLPEECNDVELLKIRWVMTSNEASGGAGTVLESGKDKIDNIIIMGDMVSVIKEKSIFNLNIYPNPTSGLVTVNAEKNIEFIQFISLTGQLVKSINTNNSIIKINLSDLAEGTYIMQTKVKGETDLRIDKVLLK